MGSGKSGEAKAGEEGTYLLSTPMHKLKPKNTGELFAAHVDHVEKEDFRNKV